MPLLGGETLAKQARISKGLSRRAFSEGISVVACTALDARQWPAKLACVTTGAREGQAMFGPHANKCF